jgi:hypothetical protein
MVLAALGFGRAPSAPVPPEPEVPGQRELAIVQRRSVRRRIIEDEKKAFRKPPRFQPYGSKRCNSIYNLLFGDHPGFVQDTTEPYAILRDRDADTAALRAIAEDGSQESRARMLACYRLRERRQPVGPGVLLGTIIEVGMNNGLDALAAYTDGSVRYINHSGKMAFFEGSGHPVEAQGQALLAVSRQVIEHIGPWTEARLPPPIAGMVRMTFLVSGGLYFGQGPLAEMLGDPMAIPILSAGHDLLEAVTRESLGQQYPA